jgi:hypothetical protein
MCVWDILASVPLPYIYPCKDYTSGAFGMPKQAKMKNKAVCSDLIISPANVLATHKSGINVLYANGSGQWVPLKALQNAPMPSASINWNVIPPNQVSYSWSPAMLDESVPNPTGVWVAMHRESH